MLPGGLDATTTFLNRNDGKPTWPQPAEWLAIRILAVACSGDFAGPRYGYRCCDDGLQWIGDHRRGWPGPSGWNGWSDTFGVKYTSNLLPCRGWRSFEIEN